RPDKKVLDESKANFIGFVMVEWARDLVVNGLVKAFRDHLLDIDSPWLIQELSTLEKDYEKNKIDHSLGAHDDRFMALGIIVLSLHMMNWDALKSVYGRSRIQHPEAQDEKKYARMPSERAAPLDLSDVEEVVGREYAWQPNENLQN